MLALFVENWAVAWKDAMCLAVKGPQVGPVRKLWCQRDDEGDKPMKNRNPDLRDSDENSEERFIDYFKVPSSSV